ncbi:adenosylcobinamide-GDP ribazoletransferase [Sphingomonas qomolangmaensis]|uniref:Adenosylcobinamide-GDP ribazoletransferase n=1 Tax=Sphingomonas qomolangmaensis TaxID=2918765 RepID=A0ABY5LB16_9SPHN|nr:adenosylcobinamide-GDP ribazoletransferase [Sphingomonas qomolangmaensis]UUL82848.1 adenosylcobinamide-GDP ribazoletransferase [Sphingomonas qomolangmaensis]
MSHRLLIWGWGVPTKAPGWAPPLLAVQFLTRIPVPMTARLSREQVVDGLARAVGWFPAVGTLVGCVTAAVAVSASAVWPVPVAVVLSLIVEALLTGAFHEDAVADFCDAFGGGLTSEDVRRIMKDSRIGSYGAVGLVLAIALRAGTMIALVQALPPVEAFVAIVAAATLGRLLVVATMAAIDPAPAGTGLAKDIGAITDMRRLGFAALVALPGLVWFAAIDPAALLFAFLAACAFLWWFRRLLLRRIGGSTGDCLGFAAYAGQLIALLAASAR